MEACGNGSGILHRENEGEMAHFRAKWRVKRWRLQTSDLELRVSGGFAELQVAADEPGFSFGRPTRPDPVETAGPEAGTSIRWNLPWAYGFEFLVDLSVGAAWLEHAPSLIVPSSRFQTFGEFTVGVGY